MATDSFGDYFMWFPNNDEVSGETTDETFKSQRACEIESFSFKLWNERASTDDGGEDKEKGKLKFGEITVKKSVDLASAFFYQMCSKGSRVDTVMLAARKAGGSRMLYNQYELRNVLVKEISWETGSLGVAETLVLAFKIMGFKYNRQAVTGKGVAVNKVWYWDTVSNSSSLGLGGKAQFLNPFDA